MKQLMLVVMLVVMVCVGAQAKSKWVGINSYRGAINFEQLDHLGLNWVALNEIQAVVEVDGKKGIAFLRTQGYRVHECMPIEVMRWYWDANYKSSYER